MLGFIFVIIALTTVGQNVIKTSALPAHHTIANTDLRIINGGEVRPHAAPFAAALHIVLPNSEGMFCGGSLLSPNYILTAGHCLVNGIGAHIILGAHNIFVQEQSQEHIQITNKDRFYIHEGYHNPDHPHDLALIYLPYPVTESQYISYVKLPRWSESRNLYENMLGDALGWGEIDDNHKLSDVLLDINVPVISNHECSRDYPSVYWGNICTSGNNFLRTCRGDSGGPFMIKRRQVGITSFGSSTCVSTTPSVFISTGQYLQWIYDHTDVIIEN